jgi:hypothetical protein
MGYTRNSKGVRTYEKKGRRKIVDPMPNDLINPIDLAIQEEREPTSEELLSESKVIIGKILIGLRGSDNIYKAAAAVNKIVRSIAAIATMEKVEEISADALRKMSDEELKVYATKLIDKLAA